MLFDHTPNYMDALDGLYEVATYLNDTLNRALDRGEPLSHKTVLATRRRILAILHGAAKIEEEFC